MSFPNIKLFMCWMKYFKTYRQLVSGAIKRTYNIFEVAKKEELNICGELYEIKRNKLETDESYRRRIIDEINKYKKAI